MSATPGKGHNVLNVASPDGDRLPTPVAAKAGRCTDEIASRAQAPGITDRSPSKPSTPSRILDVTQFAIPLGVSGTPGFLVGLAFLAVRSIIRFAVSIALITVRRAVGLVPSLFFLAVGGVMRPGVSIALLAVQRTLLS